MEAKNKLELKRLHSEIHHLKKQKNPYSSPIASAGLPQRSSRGKNSAKATDEINNIHEVNHLLHEKVEQIKAERHVLNREQVMREQAECKIDDLISMNHKLRNKLRQDGGAVSATDNPSQKTTKNSLKLPIKISNADIEIKDIADGKARSYETFAKDTFRKELGSENNETPYHVACNI